MIRTVDTQFLTMSGTLIVDTPGGPPARFPSLGSVHTVQGNSMCTVHLSVCYRWSTVSAAIRNRGRRVVSLSIALAAACICPLAANRVSADDDPVSDFGNLTVEEVIARIDQNLNSTPRIEIKCRSSAQQSVDDNPAEVVELEDIDATIDFAEHIAAVARVTTGPGREGDAPAPSKSVFRPSRRVEVTMDSSETPQVVGVDEDITADDWSEYIRTSHIALPFGYLPVEIGGGYVPQILRVLEATAHPERSPTEEECIRLECESDSISFEVCVEPDGLIRRVQYNRPINTIVPGDATEFEYEVTAVENFGTLRFPVGFRTTTFRPGGKIRPRIPGRGMIVEPRPLRARTLVRDFQVTSVRQVSVDDVMLAADMQIPDGIPAYSIAAPHLRYDWEDGSLQPKTAAAATALAQRAAFESDSNANSLRWLIWLNALVVIAIVGYTVVRPALYRK